MSDLDEKVQELWGGILKKLDEEYKQDQENTNYLDKKVYALSMLKRYDEALVFADKLIAIENTARNLTSKADVYLKMGDKEKASEICDKALELEPDNKTAIELMKKIKKSDKNHGADIVLICLIIITVILLGIIFLTFAP